MATVLDENKWAIQMIKNKTLGKKPSETIRRVARYYLDCGCSENETRKILDEFVGQCEPNTSLVKWSKCIDGCLDYATKTKSIKIKSIPIYKEELSVIDDMDSKLMKKLAFTLLVLAKYWYTVNPICDFWVNTKNSEITELSNTHTTSRRQDVLFKHLLDGGYIQFSKKVDNTNCKVLFAKTDGEIVLKITDMRSIGNQYARYTGEKFVVCEGCGILIRPKKKNKGRTRKYCEECANRIRQQQNIESVKRKRENDKRA